MLGTVLTLSELHAGQNPCALQLALSEPWIMTGRVYCLGYGTYAARADLRSIVPATQPHDEEPSVAQNQLPRGQRPDSATVNARRQQLAAEAAKPRRSWAVSDPAERTAIERDAKIVNELLTLLRRSASAEVLGVLESARGRRLVGDERPRTGSGAREQPPGSAAVRLSYGARAHEGASPGRGLGPGTCRRRSPDRRQVRSGLQ